MKWLFYGLLVLGGMFSLAWYGADERQTRAQKRFYGFAAIGIWVLLLLLGNTVL